MKTKITKWANIFHAIVDFLPSENAFAYDVQLSRHGTMLRNLADNDVWLFQRMFLKSLFGRFARTLCKLKDLKNSQHDKTICRAMYTSKNGRFKCTWVLFCHQDL